MPKKIAVIVVSILGGILILVGMRVIATYFAPIEIVITSEKVKMISWLKRIRYYHIDVISPDLNSGKILCRRWQIIDYSPDLFNFLFSWKQEEEVELCSAELQGVKKAIVKVWVEPLEQDLSFKKVYLASKEIHVERVGD